MDEKQKINQLLEEHKALFEVTDMDVAQSMKGEWFFSRYNKELDYFDTLIHFTTAKELAEIMLGEMAVDIFATIDVEAETPDFPNLADDLELKASYEPHIKRLLEYLN